MRRQLKPEARLPSASARHEACHLRLVTRSSSGGAGHPGLAAADLGFQAVLVVAGRECDAPVCRLAGGAGSGAGVDRLWVCRDGVIVVVSAADQAAEARKEALAVLCAVDGLCRGG